MELNSMSVEFLTGSVLVLLTMLPLLLLSVDSASFHIKYCSGQLAMEG